MMARSKRLGRIGALITDLIRRAGNNVGRNVISNLADDELNKIVVNDERALRRDRPETSVHAIIDQYSAGCLTVAAAVVSLPSRAEYQNVTLKCSIHHLKRFFPRYGCICIHGCEALVTGIACYLILAMQNIQLGHFNTHTSSILKQRNYLLPLLEKTLWQGKGQPEKISILTNENGKPDTKQDQKSHMEPESSVGNATENEMHSSREHFNVHLCLR
ncbi:hypothetical protein LSTR_LSTR013961 [Laodelphax striatellus]|uniref:Uncharacterized protein n=1 Tax=Laodelphax striatellus TaxID=195883 RepID=A0A482WNR2_LAOST|nr:hypothetical protein LSTR_LSTR013961 [Laodelphax striatellus]